jgi:hypothetical protein
MNITQILNAIKDKNAFQPNSTNSKGPNRNPSQIPYKNYQISNYETVDECTKKLEELGTDHTRAVQECQSYFSD